MSPLLAFILAAMSLLAPDRDHHELGTAIATVVLEERPLFRDDDARLRTAAFVVAVAFRESSLRNDAVGDKGRSVCAMQIYDGPRSYLTDPEACVRRGVAMLRVSMRACGPENVLGLYAAGPNGCSSERAKRISRDRLALAAWVARKAAP